MLTHGLMKVENFAHLSTVFPDPLGIGSEASLASGDKGFSSHELSAIYLAIYVAITVLGARRYSLDWVLLTRKHNFAGKERINMTPADRMIRLLLGLLCWFLIYINIVTGTWVFVLLIISIHCL